MICVNDGSGILFGFFYQKDTADSVLKRPQKDYLVTLLVRMSPRLKLPKTRINKTCEE